MTFQIHIFLMNGKFIIINEISNSLVIISMLKSKNEISKSISILIMFGYFKYTF